MSLQLRFSEASFHMQRLPEVQTDEWNHPASTPTIYSAKQGVLQCPATLFEKKNGNRKFITRNAVNGMVKINKTTTQGCWRANSLVDGFLKPCERKACPWDGWSIPKRRNIEQQWLQQIQLFTCCGSMSYTFVQVGSWSCLSLEVNVR